MPKTGTEMKPSHYRNNDLFLLLLTSPLHSWYKLQEHFDLNASLVTHFGMSYFWKPFFLFIDHDEREVNTAIVNISYVDLSNWSLFTFENVHILFLNLLWEIKELYCQCCMLTAYIRTNLFKENNFCDPHTDS
ncbi:Hypothetical predicted protein [Podarcis lilfordi]|uniref:Uncharacterized protein n=1 Tax=Podarcis lilfordi TaxID=74358 RepID=A0AA35PAV8_9SAUR|nr:Hypothetical predicted protein [Podarcis lilfordi]